ncbi:hypothetical protein G7046_g9333 [Stylonectria norvegica]|nr:hypothetical protein G7046_g9333 [Stylonectria norvegica]
MSFGFGVGDFLAVIKLVNTVRKDFVDAPEQFQAISDDVRGLSFVLLDADVSSAQLSETQSRHLLTVVSTCGALLREVEAVIAKYTDVNTPKKGAPAKEKARRFWKRLKWEPDDVRDLRSRINAQVSILNSLSNQIHHQVLNENVQKISGNVVSLARHQKDLEREALLNWISGIDYNAQQHDLMSRRLPGSRRWLFDSAEYAKWLGDKGIIMFCPGIPGAGKTISMATVIENLQQQFGSDPDTVTSFIYCSYRNPDQDANRLLSSLLRSAIQQTQEVPQSIISCYDTYRSQSPKLPHDKATNLLQLFFSSVKRVNVLVDALDELPNTVRRPFVLELLRLQASCGINLFLTSRDIGEIQRPFGDRGALTLQIRASEEDVQACVSEQVNQLRGFVTRSPELRQEVIEAITRASDGMFLLAELHLRSLKDKKSPKAVRSALAKLPTGSTAYDDAYQEAMARIESQDCDSKDLALRALLIVTCARRPLTTDELCYALSLEPECQDLDVSNVPEIEDVAADCAGILSIDVESNIVRLVHKSTQEYFERNKARWFPAANQIMVDLCLRYRDLAASSQAIELFGGNPPFMDYAKVNWGYHVHEYAVEKEKDMFTSSIANMDSSQQNKHRSLADPRRDGLLAVAKELGSIESALVESCHAGKYGVVDVWLSVNKCDLNKRTKHSFDGKEIEVVVGNPRSMVAQLIDYEFSHWNVSEVTYDNQVQGRGSKEKWLQACLDASDDDDVLLTIAVRQRNPDMIDLLLRHSADVNFRSAAGQTGLYIAAENGFEDIIIILLGVEGIDTSLTSLRLTRTRWNTGKGSPVALTTALEIAALNGHVGCWKLLMQRESRDDLQENIGFCLNCATQHGYEDMIAELLRWPETKVKPEHLISALEAKHSLAAIALMPHRDRHVHYDGESALRLAYDASLFDAMQNLLVFDDMQIKEELRHGQLLVDAIRASNTKVVDLIVPYVDVNADVSHCEPPRHFSSKRRDLNSKALSQARPQQSEQSRRRDPLKPTTSLHVAASVFNGDVMKALLTGRDVRVDEVDFLGRSAFLLATEYGNTQVMRVLARREDIDYGIVDKTGRSARDYILQHSHDGDIFRILHSVLGFDVNEADQDGFTLLHHACCLQVSVINRPGPSGLGLIEALLEMPQVDINARDQSGNTALFWAIRTHKPAVVGALLGRKDVLLKISQKPGLNPLILAFSPETGGTYKGPSELQQGLPRTKMKCCCKPESWHSEEHCAIAANKILDLVLDHIACRADLQKTHTTQDSTTAGTTAAHQVSRELLTRWLNETTVKDQTVLFHAAAWGNAHAVDLILHHSDIDINVQNSGGWTALCHAAEVRAEQVVSLLLADARIDVNLPTHDGRTPLSCGLRWPSVTELFIRSARIDVHLADHKGRTPLSYAVELSTPRLVELLIRRNPNIDFNLADNNGRTPLSHVAELSNVPMVQLLIRSSHIDVNLADNNGHTPLSYAIRAAFATSLLSSTDVLQALLKCPSIDVNRASNDGHTPLMLGILSMTAAFTAVGYVNTVFMERLRRMLCVLNAQGLNVDVRDTEGKSAISYYTEGEWSQPTYIGKPLFLIPEPQERHEFNRVRIEIAQRFIDLTSNPDTKRDLKRQVQDLRELNEVTMR